MDLSILKLLEEDEDEYKLSRDEVDAYRAALKLDIEGNMHSSSQQFAIWNNGIGDANTNNLHKQHILESTHMKEQKLSVVGNQNQELKRQDESHLQQNPPEDHLLPERPQPWYLKQQKMSSQQAHGVEQPVGPVNNVRREAQISDLVRNLITQVDKDKGMQLRTLYCKFKTNEITRKWLLRQIRDIAGDPMTRLVTNKLHHVQPSVESTGFGGPTKSTINTTTVPEFERPISVNGPSMVQSGPIFHFQNNSSLPLCYAPWQRSVTKDQTVGSPLSSVVHVKHQSIDQAQKRRSLVQLGVSNAPVKQNNGNPRRSNDDWEKQFSKVGLSTSTTHASLDSSTMVNCPAPSETIPTLNMTSVGQKNPLEALGSSLSPSSKKQKLCGTSLKQSVKQLNDVTSISGINLKEEELLLLSEPKNKSHVTKASRRVVHEEEQRTILQKIPLQKKLAEIMAKNGIKHIHNDVELCLSLCVEERLHGLLSNIIRMSKQRIDTEKYRNRTCITSDIRKQINEMNQRLKEEWERKHGGQEKNEENDTEKEDNRSKQVKSNKEKENKMRAKAANVAALEAVEGNDAFLKWKLMAEARKKPSSGARSNSDKPYGETGFGKKQSLQKVVRSISVTDVIDVVKREPQMSSSTQLYGVYNRIC